MDVLQALSYGSKAVYLATGKKRYLAASVLRYKSAQASVTRNFKLESCLTRHILSSVDITTDNLDALFHINNSIIELAAHWTSSQWRRIVEVVE